MTMLASCLAIVAISPGGRLYGFDRDGRELGRTEARLRALGFGETSFVPVHANFTGIAAWLAASRAGIWPARGDFAKHWQRDQRFEPGMDADTRDDAIAGWRDSVRRCLTTRD